MGLVSHLKGRDAQNLVLAAASGRHIADGHLAASYTIGASPTHRIVVRQPLAVGDWEGVESVWYKGLNVPEDDYEFLNGEQVATSALFPTDGAHHGTVILDVKAPEGVGEADTSKTTPALAFGIFKTEKFPDFDASGNQINPVGGAVVVTAAAILAGTPLNKTYFAYSVNPARVLVGWLFKYGNISHARINWTVWAAWRDYLAQTETVDYTTIEDFDGFGLTGSFYTGSNFQTFISKRIDPVIEFPSSLGAPFVGQNVDAFSVRWEGKLRAKVTGTYTFEVDHDNGVRLYVNNLVTPILNIWADDGSGAFGTDSSSTIALTADQFYDIKIEWNEGGAGPAEFRLKWSATGETLAEEVIPSEFLYPKAEELPLYEAHLDFSVPTTLDQMIAAVLLVSNSIKQDVDGKLEFFCVEQLTNSFHFDGNSPNSERTIAQSRSDSGETRDLISFSRSDRRISELQNVFEATFGDLDSQYLEEPLEPIVIEVPELIAAANGRLIYGTLLDLFNMRRWQARKVLQHYVNRNAIKDLFIEIEATARTYETIVGDIGQITHALLGGTVNVQCIETTDRSPEESNTRILKFQEW